MSPKSAGTKTGPDNRATPPIAPPIARLILSRVFIYYYTIVILIYKDFSDSKRVQINPEAPIINTPSKHLATRGTSSVQYLVAESSNLFL